MKLTDHLSRKLPNNKPLLMTHLVAGYPDFETNKTLILEMANCGVELIEIQIPFSDPLADGPIITKANQRSLNAGTSIGDCLSLLEYASARVDIPLLLMAYANSVHSYGFGEFVRDAQNSGCSGFIVPDIPFDTDDANRFNSECKKSDLPNIAVISPNIGQTRLDSIVASAQGFVYVTLHVGITGTHGMPEHTVLPTLTRLRKFIPQPLAAGFGISKPEHIQLLSGKADIAVIGSKLIEVQEQNGTEAVIQFIESLID